MNENERTTLKLFKPTAYLAALKPVKMIRASQNSNFSTLKNEKALVAICSQRMAETGFTKKRDKILVEQARLYYTRQKPREFLDLDASDKS